MGFNTSSNQSSNQSQQTSSSKNQAYDDISNAYKPQTGLTGQSSNAISNLLGLNGNVGQSEGFKNYKNSSDYDFVRQQGMDGINSNNAARGLLQSGSALKAISGYNTGLASNFLDKYISHLQGLSNTGIQAGQLITQAGNTANSQGTSSGTSTGSSMGVSLQ